VRKIIVLVALLLAVFLNCRSLEAKTWPDSFYFFKDASCPLVELAMFEPGFSKVEWSKWQDVLQQLKKAGYKRIAGRIPKPRGLLRFIFYKQDIYEVEVYKLDSLGMDYELEGFVDWKEVI